MLELVCNHILSAALSLLPTKMDTPEARQVLLTIGMQESGFRHRRQMNGPAKSLWQFEISGVAEVMRHHSTADHAKNVLDALEYGFLPPAAVLEAMEDNDVLSCCFARLALWRHPDALTDVASDMWFIYQDIWRPGKPHPAEWQRHWETAQEYISSNLPARKG